MDIEEKIVANHQSLVAKCAENTRNFFFNHPLFTGFAAALASANISCLAAGKHAKLFEALAKAPPDLYQSVGYAAYLAAGLSQDHLELRTPKDLLRIDNSDSWMQRQTKRILNNPRLSGAIMGAAASAVYSLMYQLDQYTAHDTAIAARKFLFHAPVYGLMTEAALRSVRNARLIKSTLQKSEEKSKKKISLVQRIWNFPYERPLLVGGCAAGYYFFRENMQIYTPLARGAISMLAGIEASCAAMIAGAVLHTDSIKSTVYRSISNISSAFGLNQAEIRWREKLAKLPAGDIINLENRIKLAELYLRNNEIYKARERFRESIQIIRSGEHQLSHASLIHKMYRFGSRRFVQERYKEFANSTNRVLVLKVPCKEKNALVIKVEKNDYEYTILLALREILHPFLKDIELPCPVACFEEDGEYTHFMICKDRKPLTYSFRFFSKKRKLGLVDNLLKTLAILHTQGTEGFKRFNYSFPIPHSDTKKEAVPKIIDYDLEFYSRAVKHPNKPRNFGRLCADAQDSHPLEDFVSSYREEIIPLLNAASRTFVHHDVTEENILVSRYGDDSEILLIDYGICGLGNPMIDIDHLFGAFNVPEELKSGFIERYREYYNHYGASAMSSEDASHLYKIIAPHNSVCTAGTALWFGEKNLAKNSAISAYRGFGVMGKRKTARQFLQAMRSDHRLADVAEVMSKI